MPGGFFFGPATRAERGRSALHLERARHATEGEMMAERESRSLDEIAYDPKPGDRVRVEHGRGERVYSVQDVRYSIVFCEDGEEIALADWYAMCRNSTGEIGRIEVVDHR
jgi:hypothetical protein